MEVSNRFDLLASFSTNDESDEPISIDVKLPEQKIQDVAVVVKPTRSMWDVPDYVEKVIPCVLPIEEKQPVAKVKKSRSNKKPKSTVDVVQIEEDQQEVEIEPQMDPIIEVEVKQTVIQPTCPPQPYKFKPSLASECAIESFFSVNFLLNRSSTRNKTEI